ncbi:MAG: SUMF1/EgtB/PvdO family nonheme iron enzyme, partial [Sciscionella sp.]
MSTDRVRDWVQEAATRLTDLVADLDDEQLAVPRIPTVNPLLWEIGHVTWFQELFVLRRAMGQDPIVANADAIWDSAAIPHDTRWFLQLPSRRDTLDYIEQVATAVRDGLAQPRCTAALRHIARYTVHHHDMHTEALTYTRQALGYPPPVLPGLTVSEPPAAGALPGDAAVPAGCYWLGADGDEEFVHDNEKWVHPVELDSYAIAMAPVTQAEFAAFVSDGGYARRELWAPAGWSWRTAVGADAPMYWRPDAGGWQRRDFDTWVELEPHRPVSHVSAHEALAYCRWAGRRLPTEAEWEAAAIGEPDGTGALAPWRRRFPWGGEQASTGRANLDWAHMGTVDVGAFPSGDSAFGCRQMIGNVW